MWHFFPRSPHSPFPSTPSLPLVVDNTLDLFLIHHSLYTMFSRSVRPAAAAARSLVAQAEQQRGMATLREIEQR